MSTNRQPKRQRAEPTRYRTDKTQVQLNEKALASVLREQLGLTQQSFATLLGLSTVSVSRWEQKHTQPTDASRALIGLLDRALRRQPPDTIVTTLGAVKSEDELGRIISLVHLGD